MADEPQTIREGGRVRIIGEHPHAGKTGKITELMGVRLRWGKPRAMIELDNGTGYVIVTLPFLEPIP